MVEIIFYINLQVTIVGVGLPILLQVISRLDNKYNSTSVLNLFYKERAVRYFIVALILALISTILWSFKIDPIEFKIAWVNKLLEHSAEILVTACSIGLLGTFLWVFFVVYNYYTFEQLIPRLLSSRQQTNLKNQAFRDLFLFLFVTKAKEELLKSIQTYFDEVFANEISLNDGNLIEYSPTLSDIIIKVAQVQNSKSENLSPKYSRTNLSSHWLISGFPDKDLSFASYRDIWTVLSYSIEQNNAELFMDHWICADQLTSGITFNLSEVRVNENEKLIEQLKLKKLRFVRFHYSLCGLLLFKLQYSIIARIFSYTTSHMDYFGYNMLPKGMTEIFEFYRLTRVRSPLDYDETLIYHRFPGTDGLRSEAISIRWISMYAALLFIRQFTLVSSTYGYDPLAHPILPSQQREVQVWIDGLPFFKSLVSELLENEELLQTLQFNRYPIIKEKEEVLVYLDEFETHLTETFSRMKTTQPLSPDKIDTFKATSQKIIDDGLCRLHKTLGGAEEGSYEVVTIDGTTEFKLEKDAFIKDSLVHHTNFDSFTALSAMQSIEHAIQNEFYSHSSEKFSIKEDDFKVSLDQLSLSEDHVVVNIGLNLEYFLLDEEKKNRESRFENLKISELRNHNNSQKGLYILLKKDVPFLSPKIETEKPDGLEVLNEEYSSFWKVHLPENRESEDPNHLTVDVGIYLELEMHWKSEFKMIFIRIIKDYGISGDETKPEDIQAF